MSRRSIYHEMAHPPRFAREVWGPNTRYHSFMYWRDRDPRRADRDHRGPYWKRVIMRINMQEYEAADD